MLELNVRFPSTTQFIVRLGEEETETLTFTVPITEADYQDLRWYVETYATQYTTDIDDKRARGIADKLPQWGKALFEALFDERVAQRLFNAFQDETDNRLLTISARHPEILSLPWELLRDPNGTYLFNENPRVSIRRRLAGAGGGRKPFQVQTKQRLRLLLVISRPKGAPFINPRADAIALLEALANTAAVEVEFLRPATLDNLIKRLENQRQPPIDIVHFDGHGHFDENTGYLLFEKAGQKDLIAAEKLGDLLHRQSISLMVLSACQSAKMGEDAMGSVAARLTHAGIPTVLAMTHSVLVETMRQLFAAFYQNLIDNQGMGEALDNARRQLYLSPERGQRQRGAGRITLELQDWFVPVLYQAGQDMPLLRDVAAQNVPQTENFSNLPPLQEAGFFGRSKELWDIERAFVIQETRRLTLSGFGGQGKTYLAVEASRWLQRTGMFERVCFVDYSSFQGVDAVGLALSTLATVLDRNLVDIKAAHQALSETSTLLILDNLESIQAEPLPELLTVAKQWSEIGNCRVLLTTRTSDFNHPDYPIQGSLKHQAFPLSGLAEEDALAYFQSLLKLPPEPQVKLPEEKALLELFKKVDFHPLSIGILAQQLKVRRPAELGERLEALLTETPGNPLLASLNLSLERVDEEVRQWLPLLGVFRGGAMEDVLLNVTRFSKDFWQKLRSTLEIVGLVQPKSLPGTDVPYLKFHPTLAPTLWERLSIKERNLLVIPYCLYYYKLCWDLYHQDLKQPLQTRVIFQQELSNLLYALHSMLNVAEHEQTMPEWGMDFVYRIEKILKFLGLHRDLENLTQRIEKARVSVGSDAWYLLHQYKGNRLLEKNDCDSAIGVFNEILRGLSEEMSYRRCAILTKLGDCFMKQNETDQAIKHFQQAMTIIVEQLGVSDDDEKRLKGSLHGYLGNALLIKGKNDEAMKNYQESFKIFKDIKEPRHKYSLLGQIGKIHLSRGNTVDAKQNFKKVRDYFHELKEPEGEIFALQHLCDVYQKDKQWEKAERVLREAAEIAESKGKNTATIWEQFAEIARYNNRLEEAEDWYNKALEEYKIENNEDSAAKVVDKLRFLGKPE